MLMKQVQLGLVYNAMVRACLAHWGTPILVHKWL